LFLEKDRTVFGGRETMNRAGNRQRDSITDHTNTQRCCISCSFCSLHDELLGKDDLYRECGNSKAWRSDVVGPCLSLTGKLQGVLLEDNYQI
jgi:hypothetical protein